MQNIIRIGTRGSKLALWQAYFVEEELKKAGLETSIVIIETKGDKILDRSLSKIGSKGVFTEELEEQLRNGNIDVAVHSAKDLQSDLGEDFEILAFTEREKVNDVLVSRKKINIEDPRGFVVGTSSTRRVAMLKAYYPHIRVVDMRGNLQTRLRKLDENQCDALLLAYAGVHRMGYDDLIQAVLSTDTFTPAVGQGSVAIEAAKNLAPEKKNKIRTALNHPETEQCLLAERAFLKHLQGGCSIPVFGLAFKGTKAQRHKDTEVPDVMLSLSKHDEKSLPHLNITGGIISLDGKEIVRKSVQGTDPEKLGIELAQQVLDAGGATILKEIRERLNY